MGLRRIPIRKDWMEVDTDVLNEINIRIDKGENPFFDDDSFVPGGTILGIINARREGEDYRVLLIVSSEGNVLISSSILSFGMPWHEKFIIAQQLSQEVEE